MQPLDLYIGEGFEGPGVNAAHINILIGPRNGPAGQAFAKSFSLCPQCCGATDRKSTIGTTRFLHPFQP